MFPNKWALLVGASEYRRLPRLTYSSQDAVDLRDSFVQHLAFPKQNTILLSDLSDHKPERDEIFDQLGRIRDNDQIGEDDLLVFYFSGHGYFDPDSEADFLLPTGATTRNIQATSVRMGQVVEQLKATPCKHVVAFIDACREGLEDGSKGVQALGAASRQTVDRPGMATFFSCDPRERSYEIPELGHGSFTYCLLDAIQQEQVSTVRDVSEYLRANVPTINSRHNKRTQQPFLIPNPEDILALRIFEGRLVGRGESRESTRLIEDLTELFNDQKIQARFYADALGLLEHRRKTKWDTAKMNLIRTMCSGELDPDKFMTAWRSLDRPSLGRPQIQKPDVFTPSPKTSGADVPDDEEDDETR